MSNALDQVKVQISMLTTDPREWSRDDVDMAAEVWHRLDRLITDLMILRRDHGIVLAHRVDDEFTALTRDGNITLHRKPEKTEQWDGAGVLDDLAQPMIDANGEKVDAVPADTLRKVLPACEPGKVSSKWKRTALRQVVPGVEDSRLTVTDGEVLIARGPRWQRPKAKKTTPPPALPDQD
jgi:hypothetical protein